MAAHMLMSACTPLVQRLQLDRLNLVARTHDNGRTAVCFHGELASTGGAKHMPARVAHLALS